LGKVVTLACGFQMGAERFRDTAADYGVIVSLPEAVKTVADWRAGNPRIVQYWYDIDGAARRAIDRPGSIEIVRGVKIRVRDGKLLIKKPSGGVLVYHKPRLVDGDMLFDGVDQYTKKWQGQKTYGGKLVENITQSVARDIIAEALVRVEGISQRIPVMTIHDEVVYEVRNELEGKAVQVLVEEVPAWAAGLPIASKLHVAFRFGK
jgi:DNA polymerase